jgi:hypothetical protein
VYASQRLGQGQEPGRFYISPDVARSLGYSWLLEESGANLVKQLELFAPWARDSALRQERLFSLRKVLGWTNTSWHKEGDVEDGLDSGSEDDNLLEVADATLQLDESTVNDLDLLPHFPRLFWVMRSMGMPFHDMFRLGDLALSWSATFLAPRRSLQLFMTLYNCCVWEDKLSMGTRASKLIPGLATVDLRRVHVASACTFFHVLLSHIAINSLLGRPQPFANQDIAFLVGLKPGRLHAQIEELAKYDLSPPAKMLVSDRALIWKKADVQQWIAAEKARIDALCTKLQ